MRPDIKFIEIWVGPRFYLSGHCFKDSQLSLCPHTGPRLPFQKHDGNLTLADTVPSIVRLTDSRSSSPKMPLQRAVGQLGLRTVGPAGDA